MLNASSILSYLMMHENYTHIKLEKRKWQTTITMIFPYGDTGAYKLRNELIDVVPENCTFQIKDFEDSKTCDVFTTLKIVWEYEED